MTGSEDEDNSVDLILRHVSHRFPDELARALLGADVPVHATVHETQITSRHRELDRTLDVRVGDERRLFHIEWQTDMPADMPFRTHEYQTLLSLAVAAENRNGSQLMPPIESVVVLLSGREEPWPAYGSYRLSPPDAPFSGVHFRIEPVYQRTLAELEARDSPFWMIFAPLAADADPAGVERVIAALRARVSKEEFEELGTAMAVLAEADGRERGLRDVVRSLMKEELAMNNWLFKEGKAKGLEEGLAKGLEEGLTKGLAEGLTKGRQEGLQEGLQEGELRSLVHFFERRLARTLSPDERATLAERLREQSAEPIWDAVLDLSPQELVAWLTTANGA
jgi:hypothetical protein